ncbi:hypothetical protein IU500_15330 [Nocardia terpenica]|uniref:hypothetical protein n=1 Tax=Nocardia terpenica TaxID=455432 RepID=UPI0018947770|nr:hypothetical protein [Nocardia terpenica]MBF6061355.1 hypothetical protein [Nocardia terpenica]MBF6105416.1 hypothetical protein [Nocardia terpenica]MBF6113114.1 hypothetical protein [Nocardia terpenica]MBF6119244.1 hypothetical protein [Nocardia terpenica]MBF6152892.1 hypothetical protein [Nocardia terpenica]
MTLADATAAAAAAPGEYDLASGFGPKAQWYRNIRAQPRGRVWTGRRRGAPATVTPLPDRDAATALDRYRPRAWKHLRAAIEYATGAPVDTLPTVRLRLDDPR